MRTGVIMARPARAMSEELDEPDDLERADDPHREGDIHFEPADEGMHEVPRRKSDLKRYMVPLAGAILVSALVAIAWVSFAPRRGAQQDRGLLDLPQPVSASVERSVRDRSSRPPGNEMDSRLGPAAPESGAQRFEQSRVADSTEPAPQSAGSAAGPATASRLDEPRAVSSAPDAVALEQRLDRIENSLQGLRGILDNMRMELSARPAQEFHTSPAVGEQRADSLHRQLTTRDPENVRLHRQQAVNRHPPSDLKPVSQHAAARTGLPGWEIVGLSARNVALRDPGGRTHVVAIGETVVDDVELTQIDTVANRVTTTAGDITYHAAGSERASR